MRAAYIAFGVVFHPFAQPNRRKNDFPFAQLI
jgi:hypothetical protein